MSPPDPSVCLLAASGGDTVKLFDIKLEDNDPVLTYTPSPGFAVNALKWNHTNLVVASAGEDKKITLWRKNGQSMGTVPILGTDSLDNIEESILAISFSNKGSRYICSGGSGQVVRIWDLQRKRCIKWLRGHNSTIAGAMYNCKDEHLASIGLNGDLIVHNLASGAKAADLKDPNEQVLRLLDYSRTSRHLLVTAGDDGTVHLWDTTGRTPKVSWLKQHSAPTAGVGFSPSNDKIIASVGLDKKIYTFDTGSRRPSSFASYEAPFSSLAFKDDGWTLAAGTSNGRVVFYDIRGKLQPFTVLRAYSSSEAVASLCWQRSKPIAVNENTCTSETALLGGAAEDSILMPDPLPSMASSLSLSTSISGSRLTGLSGPSTDIPVLETSSSGSTSSTFNPAFAEETPHHSHLWPGGKLARLNAPRSTNNFKDDMEVFSPVVEVQPITPSLNKPWDDFEGSKKDGLLFDKKPSLLLFPSSNKRFPLSEDGTNDHPVFDWKSSSTSRQDDGRSLTALGSTPAPFKSEDTSITPPEAWGGEFSNLRLLPSRFGLQASGSSLTSGSMFSGFQDLPVSLSKTSMSTLATSNLSYENLPTKDNSSNQETSLGFPPEHFSSYLPSSLGTKALTGAANFDSPRLASLASPRRFSTYAERMSTTSNFSDAISHMGASPKTKKTGAETREELLSSLFTRSEASAATDRAPLAVNGTLQTKAPQLDPQQGSNFTLQLFQRTLEETLDSFKKSIHEDMRNIHIEILRQFHIQEVEMSDILRSVLENQAELMKEVKSLRQENQQLRQLL